MVSSIIQEQNKVLVKQNEKISKQQEDILVELSKQNDRQVKELSFELLRPVNGFPLKSVEDFLEFESEEKECRKKLVSKIFKIL